MLVKYFFYILVVRKLWTFILCILLSEINSFIIIIIVNTAHSSRSKHGRIFSLRWL